MALYEFRLPDIGEGIAEAEIVAWHVRIGDRIDQDAKLADMMTDKATVEMETPVKGLVVQLAGDVGDRVAIGSTLVTIEIDEALNSAVTEHAADGNLVAPAENIMTEKSAVQAPPLTVDPSSFAFQVAASVGINEQGYSADQPGDRSEQRKAVAATPAVRSRAIELGIDLALVRPSEDGRVRHADLDNYLRYNVHTGYLPSSPARGDKAVKITGIRRRIAENMVASKRAIPHFTYVEEIDVTELEQLRADLNAFRGQRPKITVLPLLIIAICRVVSEFPLINARYDDEGGIVTAYGAVHLGVATHTEAGLMVPIIRDAHAKNIWQLANEIARLADLARAGKLKVDELSGGTLTITSLGPLGGISTTPVINRPEVAIVGPNKIIERPVFEGDGIRRAKLMNLSISCDHRVIDGHTAASFVQAVKILLETPVCLFAT